MGVQTSAPRRELAGLGGGEEWSSRREDAPFREAARKAARKAGGRDLVAHRGNGMEMSAPGGFEGRQMPGRIGTGITRTLLSSRTMIMCSGSGTRARARGRTRRVPRVFLTRFIQRARRFSTSQGAEQCADKQCAARGIRRRGMIYEPGADVNYGASPVILRL